jgi:hypothetical protein
MSELTPVELKRISELQRQIDEIIWQNRDMPIIQVVAALESSVEKLWPSAGRWSGNVAYKNELVAELNGGKS